MGRMRIRNFSAAAVLAAAVVVLTTCSNPIDLVQAATVEVMKANDRYLEVVSFSPGNGATSVSPSTPINIEFDKQLDTSTVDTSTVEISPTVAWSFSYNDATRTLSIFPTMNGPITYTITLKNGLKSIDGRILSEGKSWSYTTKLGPSGSVFINSNATYTNSNTGNSITVEANGAAAQYRYALSKQDLETAGWNNITTRPFTITGVSLAGTQGTNTVYFEFTDGGLEFTGTVNPISDSIILDSIPPVVSSFSINSGAYGTTSTSVTLSQSVSDATSGVQYMQFMNTGGGWSANETYATSKAWSLNSTVGTRQTFARFTDRAGNAVTVSDAIVYGAPTVTSATLNSTSKGTVTVGWDSVSADIGTNVYYLYRRDYPSGSSYTYLGNTTGTSLNVVVPEGALYNFHVAVYNAAAGGVGPYSSTSSIGYTSDIAIIYGTDESPAAALKTTLTNSNSWKETYGVSGTMPTWSVTLIPESLVSSTYTAGNIWYGYPVIITAGTSLHSTANKVRNVTAHGKGVIAMGGAGAQLLDVVNTNWTTWGYTGTKPAEIGWGPSGVSASSVHAYTWFSGHSTWTYPLTCPPYIPTTDITSAQLAYTAVARVSVYRASNTNPTDGWLYCRDNIDHYFPVVRQGRFLQYGFYSPPLDRFTGMTYTVNLVNRMSSTYYP